MLTLELSTRRLRIVAGSIVLGATLAACGSKNSAAPAPAPAPSPVSQFISFVANIVNSGAANTAEPSDISNVAAATTETVEPVAVQ